MKYLASLLAGMVVLAAVVRVDGFGATAALFTDSGTSSANSVTADQLGAPALNSSSVSGTGATAQVTLNWTAPASGNFQDRFEVLRLAGACGTPSTVVQTVTPGSATSNSASPDVPGAAGQYCYAVRGKFGTSNWVSPLSNLLSVNVAAAPTTKKLYFTTNTAVPNTTCSTASLPTVQLTSPSSGSYTVANGKTAFFIGVGTEVTGLGTTTNKAFTLSLNRLSGPAATDFTVTLGYCTGATFTAFAGGGGTVSWSGTGISSTTITLTNIEAIPSGSRFAIRLVNNGNNANKDIEIATNGTSFIDGPFTP